MINEWTPTQLSCIMATGCFLAQLLDTLTKDRPEGDLRASLFL